MFIKLDTFILSPKRRLLQFEIGIPPLLSDASKRSLKSSPRNHLLHIKGKRLKNFPYLFSTFFFGACINNCKTTLFMIRLINPEVKKLKVFIQYCDMHFISFPHHCNSPSKTLIFHKIKIVDL